LAVEDGVAHLFFDLLEIKGAVFGGILGGVIMDDGAIDSFGGDAADMLEVFG
jgi:hypothetical protein